MKWSELTSDQRNQLIHEKVMGNPDLPCTGRFVSADYVGSGRRLCISCGATCVYPETPQHHPSPPPRYSESMDMAWLIVEHLRKDGFGVHVYTDDIPIYLDLPRDALTNNYEAAIFDRKTLKDYSARADTACEAICMAALRSCGIEVEP